jgi:hypothetical protein
MTLAAKSDARLSRHALPVRLRCSCGAPVPADLAYYKVCGVCWNHVVDAVGSGHNWQGERDDRLAVIAEGTVLTGTRLGV